MDVAVLGSDGNDIAVATSGGVTILRAEDATGFKTVSHIAGTDYQCVLGSAGNKDVLFALTRTQMMVISLAPPSNPELLKTINVGTQCWQLSQIRRSAKEHVVYVTCGSSGVYGVDVSDVRNPFVIGGRPIVVPIDGDSKGIVIDDDRKIMIVSTIYDDSSIYLYDVSNSSNPVQKDSDKMEGDWEHYAHDVTLHGTTLYVAASDRMVIYETKNMQLQQIGWCCGDGPDLELYGVAYFDGVVYGSDFYEMMVAINVTDPVAPSYMGHRMLPRQGYTYSYGRGIMVTATLGNGIVRVFQCGETGGLFVFSDTAPLPTPTPPTPLPPPPAVQPDCSKLSVKQTCLVGDIVMSEHMVEACKTEVCGQMTNSWVAGIDGAKDAAFSKAGDACTFTTSSSPGRYVCGPAPPYTLYIEQYDKDAFPDYSYVRDVDMPPQIRSTILVAGSYELTVMQLQDNNRIKPVGRIPGNYNGVLASSQYGTAFGLRSNYLDVIDITNPEAPEKLGSVSWSAYGCSYLAEHRLTTKHYVYVSCPDDGVWGIDVTDGAKPISINGYSVGAVKPATGKTEGLAVDWGRHLLFVATSGGEDSGVHMYNISSHPGGPVEITNYETDDSAYEIVIMGTTLYVSADTKLAIYDTTNYVLQQVGVCCGYGPDMHLRGLSTFGGLMYAADDSGSLLVMNVSNPALPFYIGHRSFSSSTGSGTW
ncbi:hypothetical protein DIPPA_19689 [Diplonema papillatum]|nr:hypothetical protein DIPPA_19689 [Diplonema papillatum]